MKNNITGPKQLIKTLRTENDGNNDFKNNIKVKSVKQKVCDI